MLKYLDKSGYPGSEFVYTVEALPIISNSLLGAKKTEIKSYHSYKASVSM